MLTDVDWKMQEFYQFVFLAIFPAGAKLGSPGSRNSRNLSRGLIMKASGSAVAAAAAAEAAAEKAAAVAMVTATIAATATLTTTRSADCCQPRAKLNFPLPQPFNVVGEQPAFASCAPYPTLILGDTGGSCNTHGGVREFGLLCVSSQDGDDDEHDAQDAHDARDGETRKGERGEQRNVERTSGAAGDGVQTGQRSSGLLFAVGCR